MGQWGIRAPNPITSLRRLVKTLDVSRSPSVSLGPPRSPLALLLRRTVQLLQVRMASGIHGLSKVSPGPALPYPYTPCERASPEVALKLFLWVFHPQGGWPADVLFPLGYPMPYRPGGDDALVLISVILIFFLF
jgi:hypothetical protein